MKRGYRCARCLGAALVAACVILTGTPGAWAAPEGEEALRISTPQELAQFSRQCMLDAWSEEKTVLLTADLDLSGVDFQPIPVFRGVFDGGGHTIKNLELTDKGSRQGLFRIIESGGVVRDLTVEGRVAPEGSAVSVGLLAGENYGQLSGCTARGSVAGLEDTGGLVGSNFGTLSNCVSEAAVTGDKNTGGVAGSSAGRLDGCTNRGEVNTSEPAESLTDPVENTGGIVGRTTGAVSGCVNDAAVGYPHTGYSVGGVAGIHSGVLSECRNSGLVQGRRAVGGVVGRFLPETALVYGQDPVEVLNTTLSGLSELLSTLSGQLSDTASAGVTDLEDISSALDGLRQSVSTGREQASGDVQTMLDSVHADLQAVNDASGQVHNLYRSFSDDLDQLLENWEDALDVFRDKLSAVPDSADQGLMEAVEDLRKDIGNLEDDLDDLGDELSVARRSVENFESSVQSTVTGLQRILSDGAQQGRWPSQIIREMSDFLRRQVSIQTGAASSFHSALDGASRAAEDMRGHMHDLLTRLDRHYTDTSGAVRDAWEAMDAAAGTLEERTDAIQTRVKDFGNAVSGRLEAVNDRVDSIENTLDRWTDLVGDMGAETFDEIDGYLEDVKSVMDRLTDAARQSNDAVTGTVNAIIRQLERVRLAANGLTEAPEYTLEDQSEDESGEDGLILSARNLGEVSGDANVGGVAGIISVELDGDPEEDWDWDSDEAGLLSDVTAVVRAAVRACENAGAVTARNESAGGIVGRADLGAVLECTATGPVTVENGAWCGGIAGYSRKLIRRCYALCELSGVDNVGGIAGEGVDIDDCRSMVRIDAAGEKLGAVAGSVDPDGAVTGCYTVSEGLGCLDGTDRAGRAQGLPYEEFAACSPELFQHFALTFLADGETVGSVPFSYGGNVASRDIPAVPDKEGYYAAWEEFELQGLTRSRTVEAVYTPWTATISSGGARPVMLAEGSFSPAAGIAMEEYVPEEVPPGGKLSQSWSYAITDPQGGDLSGVMTVRVLCPEGERVRFRGGPDETWSEADNARRDGSYLVFQAPARGQLALVTPPPSPLPWLAVGAGAVLVLLLTLRRRRGGGRKKGRTQAAPPRTQNQAPDQGEGQSQAPVQGQRPGAG